MRHFKEKGITDKRRKSLRLALCLIENAGCRAVTSATVIIYLARQSICDLRERITQSKSLYSHYHITIAVIGCCTNFHAYAVTTFAPSCRNTLETIGKSIGTVPHSALQRCELMKQSVVARSKHEQQQQKQLTRLLAHRPFLSLFFHCFSSGRDDLCYGYDDACYSLKFRRND